MLPNPNELIHDFVKVSIIAGTPVREDQIRHEVIRPPHSGLRLPPNVYVVYAFSLSSNPRVVLKVGKAGPKSVARFVSQHYLPRSCKSNVANSLCVETQVWEQLGISGLNEDSAGEWLRAYTDRDHFYMAQGAPLINLLEIFLQCRLRPLFEG